jgi:hypothetical protein
VWKRTGYEVLFASIAHLSLALLHVVNTHSCGLILIHSEKDTNSAACGLCYGSKPDIASATLWLVNVLFHFCSYPKHKPMAEDVPDVAYGEAFT